MVICDTNIKLTIPERSHHPLVFLTCESVQPIHRQEKKIKKKDENSILNKKNLLKILPGGYEHILEKTKQQDDAKFWYFHHEQLSESK